MSICPHCNGCGWDNPAQGVDKCAVCGGMGTVDEKETEMHRVDIMLDLETWGKKPGCDIRSIGACVFNPLTGFVHDGTLGTFKTFYVATDNVISFTQWKGLNEPTSYNGLRYPLTRDPETVQWWKDQSPEAQAAFENPVDLRRALFDFTTWLGNVSGHPTTALVNGSFPANIRIWANDPHFDVSILAAVFDAVGLPVPWHYRSPRSMKTAIDMAGLKPEEYCNYGTAHNALDDAIAQAMTVCKAYERLGLNR